MEAKEEDDRCVECSRLVKKRQQAVTCDSCNGWVHRKHTGISYIYIITIFIPAKTKRQHSTFEKNA